MNQFENTAKTPGQLAALMRAGQATGLRQETGVLIWRNYAPPYSGYGKVVGACALGMALVGSGVNPIMAIENPDVYGFFTSMDLVRKGIAPVTRKKVVNPITGKMNTIGGIIISLNDTHLWSVEKIAGWLDSLDEPSPLAQEFFAGIKVEAEVVL